ncbi:MAG TPA: calcium-binding protein, partial [Solirubrobacter sp.]|nr:calcium-binding protein [Solirubrobacter sp.]
AGNLTADDAAADAVVALGTAGPDAVTLTGDATEAVVDGLAAETSATGADPALDTLTAATGVGEDTIAAAPGVSAPVNLNGDGGADADTATFRGTGGDDQIGVVSNGAEVATIAGATRIDTVTENLVVQGLGGSDTITGTGNLAALTALTEDGGSGADDLRGGNGADTLLGGSGNDFVDGNQGADSAQLGSGNDTFNWDPGDGSDVVEGQGGSDALSFNGSNIGETIDVAANGARARLTRNIANVAMDFDGIEDVTVHALGGTDQIVSEDLTGTAVRDVTADLTTADGVADGAIALGTAGPDALTVGGDATEALVEGLGADVHVTGADPALDAVTVSPQDGDDTVTAGIGVAAPLNVNVDGGIGDDTTRFAGTAGDDEIGVFANGAEVSTIAGATRVDTVTEHLVVQGLGGADTLSATGNLAALTALAEDGGSGTDIVRGGNGADTLLGGSGADFVDGNQGADSALLGSGNDTFQWDPGDGSDVVEGQGGSDRLQFNGSNIGELIDVTANGDRTRLTRNIAGVAMDLASVEAVGVRAFAGTDQLTVGDLAGTATKTVDADLSALGGPDGVPDTVVVDGTEKPDRVRVDRVDDQVRIRGLAAQTRISGSELLNDTLRIQTLGGDDSVAVDPDAELLISPVIDLGADD